jgi:peptidoglycan/LPS O-acetylase OafA/YrhL
MTRHGQRRADRDTLQTGLDLHHNGLNLLRLVFASLVIVHHGPRLTGLGHEITVLNVSIGGLAVGGFFAISGYLITRSRMHLPGRAFALRRVARIYPAYWLCLIVTAFGLSALMATKRGGWSFGAAVDYVVYGIAMVGGKVSVGGTLEGAPMDAHINAALWTLPVELLCYLGVGVLLTIGFARKRLRLISIGGLAGVVLLGMASGVGQDSLSGILSLAASFGSGMVLYAWSDRVILDGRLAFLAAILFVLAFQTSVTTVLGCLPFAYLCLWLGARCPVFLRGIGARNDISYGVYLYGFPVQQTLTAFGVASIGVVGHTLVAFVCVVPLAWLSWLTVERPLNRAAKGYTAGSARSKDSHTPDAPRGPHSAPAPTDPRV